MQLPPYHTADEMRAISDFVHRGEGAIVAVVALLVIAEEAGRLRNRRLWPATVCIAGLFLFAALLAPHHGLSHARSQWAFVFGDAQQRQHLLIAVLVTVGGLVELLNRAGRLKARRWALVWPAAIASVGIAFLLHTQHGTGDAVARAVTAHRLLAGVFIVAGIARAAEVLRDTRTGLLRYAWGVILLIAAGILFTYREPAGAYAEPHPSADREPGAHGPGTAAGEPR